MDQQLTNEFSTSCNFNEYCGFLDGSVTVNGRQLPARPDLNSFHCDRYAWGYNGTGPEYLALAILSWELPESTAVAYYEHFKREVICNLPFQQSWILRSFDIHAWLDTVITNKISTDV